MNDKEKLEAIDKESSWQKIKQTDKEKIQEALKLIDGLLESPHVKRVMVTPEVSLPVILEKLKETLENN